MCSRTKTAPPGNARSSYEFCIGTLTVGRGYKPVGEGACSARAFDAWSEPRAHGKTRCGARGGHATRAIRPSVAYVLPCGSAQAAYAPARRYRCGRHGAARFTIASFYPPRRHVRA